MQSCGLVGRVSHGGDQGLNQNSQLRVFGLYIYSKQRHLDEPSLKGIMDATAPC